MLRRLYNWTLQFAGHRRANAALAGVSFSESSFFPIPPDVLLIPMVLARRDKAWQLAGICTLASVLGGVLGYAIGALFYDTIGMWLMKFYGYTDQVEGFRAFYAKWGSLAILIKGLLPIPYKIVTITSGFSGYDIVWFVVLSALTRGARFYGEAWALWHYGEPVREFLERRLEVVLAIAALVFVSGFVLVIYVF